MTADRSKEKLGDRAWRFLRTSLALRVVVTVVVAAMLLWLVYSVAMGTVNALSVVASALVFVSLALFAYIFVTPDSMRSRYTEKTLSTASQMLREMMGGLTPESADAICRHLMPETKATTVAITNESVVLACIGELEDEFPPGSAVHTPATRYVLEHGIMQSFTDAMVVEDAESGAFPRIPAGIVAPLKVRGRTVGTLKFFYRRARDVNRTQYALASGFADLLSTQLATIELDRQAELAARAEVRALQAQINPHFLFNTLNTIASLTRTDPMRARELLREFASFYRTTLESSDSFIPVLREVQQTERYLLFERARFGDDRIVEESSIEDGAEDEPVPSFIIQPLVENAVRHAMPDEGPLNITVTVRREDAEMLVIEVADNGLGMDAKTASQLFSGRMREPDASAPQGSGTGVAMYNISERIKRFYGPRSRTSVVSELGEGTVITLCLDLEGGMVAPK